MGYQWELALTLSQQLQLEGYKRAYVNELGSALVPIANTCRSAPTTTPSQISYLPSQDNAARVPRLAMLSILSFDPTLNCNCVSNQGGFLS